MCMGMHSDKKHFRHETSQWLYAASLPEWRQFVGENLLLWIEQQVEGRKVKKADNHVMFFLVTFPCLFLVLMEYIPVQVKHIQLPIYHLENETNNSELSVCVCDEIIYPLVPNWLIRITDIAGLMVVPWLNLHRYSWFNGEGTWLSLDPSDTPAPSGIKIHKGWELFWELMQQRWVGILQCGWEHQI